MKTKKNARNVPVGLESLEARRLMCIDHLGNNTLSPLVAGEDKTADAIVHPEQRRAGAESAWTQGNKRVLYIRVAYADTPTVEPESLTQAQGNFAEVNAYWAANSFGTVSFTPTYTPLVVLPHTLAEYSAMTDGDFYLYDDARAAAVAANPAWNYANYDLDAVRFNGGPGSYAGQAYVGDRGVWLKSSAWGVSAHEFGHNFGLWHANSFTPALEGVPIGPGSNVEYGDFYDVMGSSSVGQRGHFNPYEKNLLGWIDDSNVGTAAGAGTYRIYAHDLGGTRQPDIDYGLKVARGDAQARDYWLDYRQNSGFSANNMSILNGIGLRWGPWGDEGVTTGSNYGSQYLDTTPLTNPGKSDGNIAIGRTFSDLPAGIHITPLNKVAASGDNPAAIDVRVNFGSSPNAPAIASLTASSLAVAPGATVDFSAIASDLDGDELAYAWAVSDGAISTASASTFSRTFATSGYYQVRLSVSDMKGKVSTRSVVVQVGSPTTGIATGIVRDPAGKPLANVLIRGQGFGSTTYNTYTEADGTFTMVNLPVENFYFLASSASHAVAGPYYKQIVAGSSVTTFPFTCPPRTYAVSGHVNAYGASRSGLTVLSDSSIATTNAAGDFTIALPAGQPSVRLSGGWVAKPVTAVVDFAAATVSSLDAFKVGDCNGDSLINNADISSFVQALTDSAAFAAAHPAMPTTVADVNADGIVNNADIAPFVALLTGGRPAGATPPASAAPRAEPRSRSLALSDDKPNAFSPRGVLV